MLPNVELKGAPLLARPAWAQG